MENTRYVVLTAQKIKLKISNEVILIIHIVTSGKTTMQRWEVKCDSIECKTNHFDTTNAFRLTSEMHSLLHIVDTLIHYQNTVIK